MENRKISESIDFKGKNGGSGWTRTTDLTFVNYRLRTSLELLQTPRI